MSARKLSDTDVILIRRLRKLGVSYAVIAKGFGLAVSTVYQIVERVTYKGV